MILLTNTTTQTLAPGQSLIFDEIINHSGCGECHRRNSSAVRVRPNATYDADFKANIGSETAATQVQLSVAYDGAVLPETVMISTAAAVGDLNNVSSATSVRTCCGYGQFTVINSGTVPVIVAPNSALLIRRRG